MISEPLLTPSWPAARTHSLQGELVSITPVVTVGRNILSDKAYTVQFLLSRLGKSEEKATPNKARRRRALGVYSHPLGSIARRHRITPARAYPGGYSRAGTYTLRSAAIRNSLAADAKRSDTPCCSKSVSHYPLLPANLSRGWGFQPARYFALRKQRRQATPAQEGKQ